MAPVKKPATYDDLYRVPENLIGEIIEGELYVSPRPRPRHQNIVTSIARQVQDPYHFGRGGPGGWIILVEPGVELPRSPEVVPDVAGWRRERVRDLNPDKPIDVVPDWVCEIDSPSTRRLDRKVKRPFYARIGVGSLWTIDPVARTLEVDRLVDGKWLEIGVWSDEDAARAEPFADIELHLADWWLPEPPTPPTGG